ncbi:UNVERIFIED_CONTAM: uncharacterized protein DUF1449 [Acetivibrio alkalicellulosi]
MLEFFKTIVTGVNIIPTTLLGLTIFYWLTVIIGVVDIDFLDVDVDTDVSDAGPISGPFHGILTFINLADLPLMLVLSVINLVFWAVSMITYMMTPEFGELSRGLLLIPAFILSVLITKVITTPLKGLFRQMYKDNSAHEKVEGMLCSLLCDVDNVRLGQAEVEREGAPFRINVKVEEGESLKKGDKVLVICKDTEKDFYYVKKFKGVE